MKKTNTNTVTLSRYDAPNAYDVPGVNLRNVYNVSNVYDKRDVPSFTNSRRENDPPSITNSRRENDRPSISNSRNEKDVPTAYKKRNETDIRNSKDISDSLNKDNETHKAKLESEREKRECEEKIRTIKNHIQAMKRRQENMNKKLMYFKIKEDKTNNAKKHKEDTKKAIDEYNIIRRTELEEKRKNILINKNATNKGMKESSQRAKMDKAMNYKKYIKEREEAIKQSQIDKVREMHDKNEKIKAVRENNRNLGSMRKQELNKNYGNENEKIYENNIEETKLLREQIRQLQSEEDALLNKLNNTRNRYDTYSSNDRYCLGYRNKRYSKRKTSFDY